MAQLTVKVKGLSPRLLRAVYVKQIRADLAWCREELRRAEFERDSIANMSETRLYTYRLGLCDALRHVVLHLEEELAALGYEDTTRKEGRP